MNKPLFVYFLLLFGVFSSCSNSKSVVYFSNLRDTAFANAEGKTLDPVIQKNDVLSITVTSLNPKATEIFFSPASAPVTTASATGAVAPGNGYLVNANGTIQFPVLGSITAAGLTKSQLADTIAERIKRGQYLIDPLVSIRFLNFRVTVLGEVARPGVITVPNEKITILEALAQAGDLTIYARRDNVLLIREDNNQKIAKRINLNSSEIFSSPYYYLKANDIIYAEPNSSKVSSASTTRQLLPVIISALSFIVIILDRVFR